MHGLKDGYMCTQTVIPHPPKPSHLDACYLIEKMEPIVERGVWENKAFGTRHAVREAALTAYLMGKGYDERTAHSMVEYWIRMGLFPPHG